VLQAHKIAFAEYLFNSRMSNQESSETNFSKNALEKVSYINSGLTRPRSHK
jgi:hypothetical protein